LAGWGARFVAWLIDIILIDVAVEVISLVVLLPFLVSGFSPVRMMMEMMIVPPYWQEWPAWVFRYVGSRDAVRFLYWTVLEAFNRGRSLGKKLMGISVVDTEGKPVGLLKAAVESFGKGFLLPVDVIIGLIAFGRNRQRLFNALSGTIVVRSRTRS
jgi:uncharacterized RDD family membrane protein YckC